MKRVIQSGTRGSWADIYNIPTFNGVSDPIPAYAVCKIFGGTFPGTTSRFTVGQPDGTDNAKYIIAPPEPTPAISVGVATDQYPALAAISGSPAINQQIGPVGGSWAMSVNGRGFLYLGGLQNGIGRVASHGNSDFPLVFIKNTSGLDKNAGTISGLVNLITPPPNMPLIPTFGFSNPQATQPFAILTQTLRDGDTGYAAPTGVVATSINFTDFSHTRADVIGGDFGKLQSGANGPAIILWRAFQAISGQSSLGIQNAVVLIDRSATNEDVRAVTTTTGSAASGIVGGQIIPGVGFARVYTPPAATTIGGTPWQPTNNIVLYENWSPGTVAINKTVLLKTSRADVTNGGTLYVLVTESCKPLPISLGG